LRLKCCVGFNLRREAGGHHRLDDLAGEDAAAAPVPEKERVDARRGDGRAAARGRRAAAGAAMAIGGNISARASNRCVAAGRRMAGDLAER